MGSVSSRRLVTLERYLRGRLGGSVVRLSERSVSAVHSTYRYQYLVPTYKMDRVACTMSWHFATGAKGGERERPMTTERSMAPDDSVLLQVEGTVATITLNRPDRLNALDLEMQLGYIEALDAADADQAVRVVVVTGAGRGFCAGADLGVLAAGPQAVKDLVPNTAVMPVHALRIRKPVIAAVNGPVAGIGFAYMCCSDFRLVAAGTKMSTSFASLGLVAEYGLSWLLPRLVGLSAAVDLLYTARAIDADEALQMGLVNAVYQREQLVSETQILAERLSGVSPYSLAVMKHQIYRDLHEPLSDSLERTLGVMWESFEGPDFAEAVAARQEKRPVVFPPLS
jgi:enoyl-CoA hydratase/carnithine racemase